MIDRERLPLEIRESTRAVLWNVEERDDDLTKVPYRPQHPEQRGAVDNPGTWDTFDAAHAAYERGAAHGVGVVLGDTLTGVDLDKCRDPQTGLLASWATKIIRRLN